MAPQRGRRHATQLLRVELGRQRCPPRPGINVLDPTSGGEQEREPGAKQQRRAARSARPIDSDGIDAQVRSRVSGGRRRGRRPGVLTGVIVCVRHPLGGPYPISTGSD